MCIAYACRKVSVFRFIYIYACLPLCLSVCLSVCLFPHLPRPQPLPPDPHPPPPSSALVPPPKSVTGVSGVTGAIGDPIINVAAPPEEPEGVLRPDKASAMLQSEVKQRTRSDLHVCMCMYHEGFLSQSCDFLV